MPSKKLTPERINSTKAQFQVIETKLLSSDKPRYFRLPYDTALGAIDADLSKTAYRLWMYLSATYPFGDYDVELPSQTELGVRLNVSRQTINLAAAELQAAGLWDFWPEKWKGRNLKGYGYSSSRSHQPSQPIANDSEQGVNSTLQLADNFNQDSNLTQPIANDSEQGVNSTLHLADNSNQDSNLTQPIANNPEQGVNKTRPIADNLEQNINPTPQVSEKSDTLSKKSDTRCRKKLIRCQENPTPCQKNLTPINQKPASDNDSEEDNTNQTYSEFIKTLSEIEREKFLEFCHEATASFNPKINDIEAWLAGKNQAGKKRWQVYYEKFIVSQRTATKKYQGKEMMKKFQQEIEQQREQAIQNWRNQRDR
jgi:hypothetical protein